jgi:MFS family permease
VHAPIRQARPASRQFNSDFWLFWAGQTISNLGNSFTEFALPLLVFQMTGSAVSLALATAIYFLPYLFFGLVIGAWVDRWDRKRLMVSTDLLRAGVIATIPLLAAFGWLPVWWLYLVQFAGATLQIFFESAEFAAIPSLVKRDNLVTANGRIQASYSAARVIGPALAGLLAVLLPIHDILVVDALTFAYSALTLALVRRSFNAEAPPARGNLRQDVAEGVRYVWGHPVLRSISIMMALINFVYATTYAQLILFAKEHHQASDAQAGFLYSAGAVGIIVFSLAAGAIRKRWPFSRVALGALSLQGLLLIVLAVNRWYAAALPLWAMVWGLGALFDINAGSLRQSIVPNQLLGRVVTIAGFVAWSAIPLGTTVGGLAIEWTGNVALIYGLIGAVILLVPPLFAFGTLGRAEEYVPQADAAAIPRADAHQSLQAG